MTASSTLDVSKQKTGNSSILVIETHEICMARSQKQKSKCWNGKFQEMSTK